MAQKSDAQKKKNKGNKLNAQQQKRAAAKRVARAEEKAAKRKKKDKKKRTGKEIAIIVVSVVMVVSILLPSLSSIINKNSSSSSSNSDEPTSYEEAQDKYQPMVDEQQAKLDKDSNDTQAMYDLATNYYNWAGKASSYAGSDDDKKNFANDLYQKAIDEYTAYLDATGNDFDTSDEKTAALNRAMANKSLDKNDDAKQQLEDLGNKANYASAWAQLGMLYENDSESDKAMLAFEKVVDSNDSSASNYRSWAVQRLQALRKNKQSGSGGPEAFVLKCNFWQGANPAGDTSSNFASVAAFRVHKIETSSSDSGSNSSSNSGSDSGSDSSSS